MELQPPETQHGCTTVVQYVEKNELPKSDAKLEAKYQGELVFKGLIYVE